MLFLGPGDILLTTRKICLCMPVSLAVLTPDIGSFAPSNELGGLIGILQAAKSAADMLSPFLVPGSSNLTLF